MINCNFCGKSFSSPEEFEKHIDHNCSIRHNENVLELTYQEIQPSGKIELKKIVIGEKKLKYIRETTDEFLQREHDSQGVDRALKEKLAKPE